MSSKSAEFYESYNEKHFGVFFMPHSVYCRRLIHYNDCRIVAGYLDL